MDREKVIKGLENCITGFDCPPECPYLDDCNDLMKPMFVELAKDALALLKEVAEKIQHIEEENNFLKSMQHGRKKVGSAEMKLQKIKAEFIGRDGSMHFRRGKVYDLWFLEKNGKYYISRPRMDATAIPYDTMIAVKKNWNILSQDCFSE